MIEQLNGPNNQSWDKLPGEALLLKLNYQLE